MRLSHFRIADRSAATDVRHAHGKALGILTDGNETIRRRSKRQSIHSQKVEEINLWREPL